jgi:endo-1,4-beta-xylanase
MRLLNKISLSIIFILLLATNIKAQLETNGSFENTNLGVVTGSDVKGWVISTASGVSPAPVFEIEGDVTKDGSKALKVTVNGTGANQWDIQIIADSIPVYQGGTYNLSIWARADLPGAQINVTAGYFSTGEIKAIRPASPLTRWTRFTMQFTITNNEKYIRVPIHFSYAGNSGNPIYIDNLQVSDANANMLPVTVQAESGKLGSNFSVLTDNKIKYITPKANYTGLTSPGDTSRIATYQITFPDSGRYNLFARVRVGANGFNDDSFFYATSFGVKDTSNANWIMINGIASGGFSDSSSYVNGAGSLGTSVWKWVNISKYNYSGGSGVTFHVNADNLIQTFQIGSREDGLDIDKFVFGKTNILFTVGALDNGMPGTISIDSTLLWKGPALAQGLPKFLGSAGDNVNTDFANYWTQITPENAGKWGSVGTTTDTTQWNWSGLDNDYNYAKNHGMIFKDHNLIWGSQQPSWISGLDSASQYKYIETWIRMVGRRYPNIALIDVMNEALDGHNPPDGQNGHANYKKALGGNGSTGWDWVVNAFKLARKYLPNAKLLINDYGIINNNSATDAYLKIINILKDRNLIDGIGEQGHGFENNTASALKYNLDKLAATGLPIYITEFDLNIQDNTDPMNKYKELFPMFWQHPSVKGVTLWGYIQGRTWVTNSYLVNSDGTARPALLWLAGYVKNNPVGVKTTESIPTNYELLQNYPNPFNPVTKIKYSIIKEGIVTLEVFDILGRKVQTLINEHQTPGKYSVDFNASKLASGVYIYHLRAGDFNAAKKLLLLK